MQKVQEVSTRALRQVAAFELSGTKTREEKILRKQKIEKNKDLKKADDHPSTQYKQCRSLKFHLTFYRECFEVIADFNFKISEMVPKKFGLILEKKMATDLLERQ